MSRPEGYGEALWVSPSGKAFPIDEEHPDWLRAMAGIIGMDPMAAHSDDANYHAIRLGWARVVIFEDGQRTNIAASDWATIRRAFIELVRLGWSSIEPGATLAVDVFGGDPTTPDEIGMIHDLRAFMREPMAAMPTELADDVPAPR